jgi:hypothetical protein
MNQGLRRDIGSREYLGSLAVPDFVVPMQIILTWSALPAHILNLGQLVCSLSI